jgi:hypothetical protein
VNSRRETKISGLHQFVLPHAASVMTFLGMPNNAALAALLSLDSLPVDMVLGSQQTLIKMALIAF